MKSKNRVLKQKTNSIVIICVFVVIFTLLFFLLEIEISKSESISDNIKSTDSGNETHTKISKTTLSSENPTIVDNEASEKSTNILPGDRDDKKWFIDFIIITILIVVLLIFLVIFKIWNINNKGEEKKRINNTVTDSNQKNLGMDNWFVTSSQIPTQTQNTQQKPYYPVYTPTQNNLTFRCWQCNSPLEYKDFCPYCGWRGHSKRVVGYWGLFN